MSPACRNTGPHRTTRPETPLTSAPAETTATTAERRRR